MVSSRSKARSKTKRHVPPSRLRYEASHPTVTVRVSRELHDELRELQKTAGLSMADILRIGLGKAQPDFEEAYDRGVQDGYGSAEDLYKIVVRCARCDKNHLIIEGNAVKARVSRLLYQSGWHATACK